MPGVLKHAPRPPQSPSPLEQGVRTRIVKAEVEGTQSSSANRGGMNVTVRAATARFDVQRAYQQMYFDAHDDNDTEDGLGAALKRRFRSASYRMGGQDWKRLFSAYDRNKDGGLSVKEFIHATRRDAQVTPSMMSDAQLEEVFDSIDVDGDRCVSCEEFLEWLGRMEHGRDPIRDGVVVPHSCSDGDDNGGPTQPMKRVPFAAEYIALRRATLRSGQDLSSPKIGMLSTGEVVAVLQVRGRRMKVQRLKYQANPSQGWVSDRTADLNPIMELLPRLEWSSTVGHPAAVAERVALLNALPPTKTVGPPSLWHTSIFEGGDSRPVKGARNPTNGSTVPVPPPSAQVFVDDALKKSEQLVDRLARAMERAIEEREAARMVALAKAETVKTAFDEARQVSSELERKRLRKIEEDRLAAEELMKCQSVAEAKELLDVLENTHRVRWDALLLGKHAEVERIRLHRASLDRARKQQLLVFSAGVRQARGQKVERETSARDRATRASSALFSSLAGRSDAQEADDPKATDISSTSRKVAAYETGTKSSIDRILQKFSPRSGGVLRSATARHDRKATLSVNAAVAGKICDTPELGEYE